MDINNLLKQRLKRDGKRLHHREGQELEFKEQFSLGSLADYYRDFAAFSNNRGGLLVFGIKDSPREILGLSDKSRRQFENIDPEIITGHLLDCFSSSISWAQTSIEIDGMFCGAFYVWPSKAKPIIARKNEGKNNVIKDGDIYYRYGGRTQKIRSAELEGIINSRIEQNNQSWLNLMEKIARTGPANAAILDTEQGLIEKDDKQVLVLDDSLLGKINFIKEGEFSETKGASALKLIGDVIPIENIEVIQRVRENLTRIYPYSAKELAALVIEKVPNATKPKVWACIKENDLKNNPEYSAYNFRNKKQEDNFKKNGTVPSSTPTIYNDKAIEFIVNILNNELPQNSSNS